MRKVKQKTSKLSFSVPPELATAIDQRIEAIDMSRSQYARSLVKKDIPWLEQFIRSWLKKSAVNQGKKL
jgi:hypothetical protein